MRLFDEVSGLKDKRILMRVDFDVPIKAGVIQENFRILKQKEMIDYLAAAGASVAIVAHISSVDSFSELIPQLHLLLEREIGFAKNLEQLENFEQIGQVVLLENIRQFSGEKENSEDLAKKLSKGFDLYINNAFAVCHREHASVSAITKFLPAYAGKLIKEEILRLRDAIDAPASGKVVIMGGAKAATKIPVIKNFLSKADKILLGGVIVNDILKFKGEDVLNSVVDENLEELLKDLDINNNKLVLPDDLNIFENRILDIGEGAIEAYKKIIVEAEMVIWNGPMGLFEEEGFAEGTKAVAEATLKARQKVIGGGDTISAVNMFGIPLSEFDFVSTGGGAMLAFLAGEELPGLKALEQ